jgi:superfamily I DNA/RNA helicase
VVGDARQSIYRFRGASSVNMARFTDEYPKAKRDQLEINYRSSEEIKNAFEAIAPKMEASRGILPLELKADAGSSGISPQLRSFETQDDEVAGIAASVKELEAGGIALRDQAVLCRTNARLNDIAFGLECRGIPVLHLGSLFEREEVRDLLSLLSLLVDQFGSGLARVGAMPRYAMPLQDQYHVLGLLKETPGEVVPRLAALSQDTALSDAGRKGLKQLADDLTSFRQESTAWEFLTSYLLDRTDLIAKLGRETGVRERMKAVAIWQFLNFVRDQSQFGFGLPIQRVLNRVRSLVLLSEERDLRQIPPSALHMNAVRLMTVHGSKGLEFNAVHLPGMIVSGFPSQYRSPRCPPPKGLIEGTGNLSASDAAKAGHEEEEQCLFFVAMSRAKRHLRLYNSQKQPNGKTRRSPSPFLDWLRPGHLTDIAKPPMMALPPDAPRLVPIAVSWHADWQLTHTRLGSFDKCPRRFFYTHVLGLGGAKKATPFNQSHNCLYELIEWLAEARLKGGVSRA